MRLAKKSKARFMLNLDGLNDSSTGFALKLFQITGLGAVAKMLMATVTQGNHIFDGSFTAFSKGFNMVGFQASNGAVDGIRISPDVSRPAAQFATVLRAPQYRRKNVKAAVKNRPLCFWRSEFNGLSVGFDKRLLFFNSILKV